MSQDCIFCKIARKEAPATVVYEDEDVLAFRDINPIAPVHVLVIPKKHVEKLSDFDPEAERDLWAKLLRAVQKVAELTGVKDSGYRVVINEGPHGQQTVFHLHLHVIGGRQLRWTM
ncbi:histidine triad nucleotide-binding protein [Brockia lithotrophica]|uniref:Histidine triad (HIT) family protein n=1 Tax=Brockia lithotrophica TaxID=933949 RepID=A0A660LAF3_9BACL|nr:histidine triad nucleotide-binding protein [Brockia lithotrophica]RKQ88570.1 histidine triad (HIT) family protein [Brockia lithotrophica]